MQELIGRQHGAGAVQASTEERRPQAGRVPEDSEDRGCAGKGFKHSSKAGREDVSGGQQADQCK